MAVISDVVLKAGRRPRGTSLPHFMASASGPIALALRAALQDNKLIIYMYLIKSEYLSKSNQYLVHYISCNVLRHTANFNFCFSRIVKGTLRRRLTYIFFSFNKKFNI